MAESATRLYAIWKGIKRRCTNNHYHHFENYGGRGIAMCDEWINSYAEFKKWAIVNGYSEELTIERRDVNGDYTPKNCTWADSVEQNNNTRRNHLVALNGELYTVAELSRICGIKQNTLLYRLRRGWSTQEAVSAAVQKR